MAPVNGVQPAAGLGGAGQRRTNGGRRVQRRQRAAAATPPARPPTYSVTALPSALDREVRPLPGLHRLRRGAALPVDLHERHALVDADHQFAGAIAAGIDHLLRAELVRAHPRRRT